MASELKLIESIALANHMRLKAWVNPSTGVVVFSVHSERDQQDELAKVDAHTASVLMTMVDRGAKSRGQ